MARKPPTPSVVSILQRRLNLGSSSSAALCGWSLVSCLRNRRVGGMGGAGVREGRRRENTYEAPRLSCVSRLSLWSLATLKVEQIWGERERDLVLLFNVFIISNFDGCRVLT